MGAIPHNNADVVDDLDNAKNASADNDDLETVPADDEAETTPAHGARGRLPLAAASVTAAIAQEYLPIVRAMVQMPSASEARVRAQTAAAAGTLSAGSVAILPLQGILTPHGSMLARMFGFAGGGLEDFGAGLRAAMSDPAVKAIVIDVNSPGGLIDMVTETAAAVRAARGNGKPIVSVANTMAGSAAYWIASQADEFAVTPSGQVGSVGVFTVHEDFSKMEERLGISTTLISAGRFKAEGAVGPLSKTAIQALQSNVDDFYEMFVGDVAAGRGVKPLAVVNGYGEGRMVLAKNALPLGMVDSIETLAQVVARLGGQPVEEPDDDDVSPGDEPDDDDGDAPQARAESGGVSADRLYGEVRLEQPAWLLTS